VRIAELFCGIGGCAAAVGPSAAIVAAVDQNRSALAVYARNFRHPTYPHTVESVPEPRWREWGADVWWLSPPCPPYTRRGLQRDLDDPRARSFVTLLARVAAVRPRYVALENVPGFLGSRAHERLRDTLDRCGYAVRETLLCPTELGVPNRRERFYLVAALAPLHEFRARHGIRRTLAEFVDPGGPDGAAGLACDPATLARYARAVHVVDARDPAACAACFTSAYGRSIVRSGSYLATPDGVRRFSPAEILRLLGFPADYTLPPELGLGRAWPLVGNSVSVTAVRWVLSVVPGLEHLADVSG
jgi:site-specific DNA-cytosine methylase